jgi:HlyD family secretion protein
MTTKETSPTKRIFKVLGIVVLVLIVLTVGLRTTGIIGDKNEGLPIDLTSVERRTITQVVTASGRIQPEVEVIISPDVSGEIVSLTVVEGQNVERGQLLARIKPDNYVAQVEQAEAGVFQARANKAQREADYINAERAYRRQEALRASEAVSQSALDQAETAMKIAEASLEAASYGVRSAEARLREAREQLQRTSIFAPMDGTISQLNVELGERVVGANMMTGTDMMHIAQLDRMELIVDVNENDVVNIIAGDSAQIEIDAYPGRSFQGVVSEIANSARVSGAGTQEQVTNFPVKIRLLDARPPGTPDATMDSETPSETTGRPNFRPGMSGTVDIFTETREGVLAIPIQAVTVRDILKFDSTAAANTELEEDLRRVVFRLVDGKAEMMEVATGIADDTHLEVMSGLSLGDEVITGPYSAISRVLEPGMAVRNKESENE